MTTRIFITGFPDNTMPCNGFGRRPQEKGRFAWTI